MQVPQPQATRKRAPTRICKQASKPKRKNASHRRRREPSPDGPLIALNHREHFCDSGESLKMSASRNARQPELVRRAVARPELEPAASTRERSSRRISTPQAAQRRSQNRRHSRHEASATKSQSHLGFGHAVQQIAAPNSHRVHARWSQSTRDAALGLLLIASLFLAAARAADDFSSLAARFAFESTAAGTGELTTSSSLPPAASGANSPASASGSRSGGSSSGAGSPFVWQPLPLRATFRPLNRDSRPATSEQAAPTPPRAPRPPSPPQPAEPALALAISERSASAADPSTGGAENGLVPAAASTRFSSRDNPFGSSFFRPTPNEVAGVASSSSISAPVSTTPAPAAAVDEDDELPTRQPMTRFRPTRAPSDDADSSSSAAGPGSEPPAATSLPSGSVDSSSADLSAPANGSSVATATGSRTGAGISRDCFECICEASTNCNSQSRCQTSDVRHTRCGLFLISYDQWLATGLSRELVSREALQRDAAADERAFYDCATQRDCAQRLLAIYMERNRKDCDRDGRVDCYDMAAIHHSGTEQCASESLLDSQYWSDFNACLGFGR